MKASIEVANRQEGENIRAGLADPSARAFVITIGLLNALESNRARARVLRFVEDYVDEKNHKPTAVELLEA